MKNMSKQLKDYLHLYLGCEVLYKSEIYFLCGISTPYRTNDKTLATFSVRPNKKGFRSISHSMENFDEIKLILRPLSDMTEEEKKEVGFDAYQMLRNEQGDRVIPSRDKGFVWAARQTSYLLKQRFDLFGLIEAGLAIDKTKVSVK